MKMTKNYYYCTDVSKLSTFHGPWPSLKLVIRTVLAYISMSTKLAFSSMGWVVGSERVTGFFLYIACCPYWKHTPVLWLTSILVACWFVVIYYQDSSSSFPFSSPPSHHSVMYGLLWSSLPHRITQQPDEVALEKSLVNSMFIFLYIRGQQ